MACLLSAADWTSSERVKVGGGDGAASAYFLCCKNVRWKVSTCKNRVRPPCIFFFSYLSKVSLFILNSHELTVHSTDALQCRPTKANKGSMLIYSDIYFNIDNVVSSGPFFFFIKPNSRSRLGLNVKNERCAGASERAFMIYFSTTSPAKETCIFTKNKLPPPPPEVPFDGCGHAPTAAAVKCFMWLQKVCDWLPSSVRDLQVDSWCSGLWGGNSTFVIRVIFFFF